MKKVIITGVTGQLGSYMTDFLLTKSDIEVVGVARRTSQLIDGNVSHNLNNKNFRLIHGNLTDPHSIKNIIKNEQPDYFINFGAQTFVADSWDNPIEHFESNALPIISILEAVKDYCPSCRVYSSGSSEQFGNVEYSPQDINHPFKPRSPYGASKCAAHNIIKVWRESYNLYAVQGILFNNESPRRQDYFVTRKITKNVARIKKAINNGEEFDPLELGNLSAKRDWSFSLDFCDGVWLMLNNDIPKDYVLASGEAHSIRKFVEEAFKVVGIRGVWYEEGLKERFLTLDHALDSKEPVVLVKINPDFYRPAEVELLRGDSTPARNELGWRPKTSFKQLVKKMVENDLYN